ncbi:MAG: DJ-1 family glyoxalase III [Lachnospiraceae bacterium]
MSKVYIFFADGFEEIEALAVVDVLRRGGVETVMVSITGNSMVTSSHHVSVKCDALFEEEDFSDGDMLVLPGGMPGTKSLQAHAGLKDLILRYAAEGKKLAAICAAPSVLGINGLLKGKKAICFPGFEDMLLEAEVQKDKKVVTDGNITTAKGMGVATEFGLELLKKLEGEDMAHKVAGAIQYL